MIPGKNKMFNVSKNVFAKLFLTNFDKRDKIRGGCESPMLNRVNNE